MALSADSSALEALEALTLMKTHVVTTTTDASLSQALDLMDLYQVNGLPVLDAGGRLCGMLTEQDVVRALTAAADGAGVPPPSLGDLARISAGVAQAPVGSHMTAPPVAVAEATPLRDAAAMMLAHRLKRVPVTSPNGKVVGVLNRVDILQALFEGNL
jgi:CBS domain-containing protein